MKLTELTGVAGEYFVAAELSRRGLIASVSLRTTRGIDILVTDPDAKRQVTIQCKTRRKAGKKWILNKKCEEVQSKNHFYVFVALGELGQRPSYYIVPSAVVAKFTSTRHKKYISIPGRNGKPRADSSMRKFADAEDKYLDRWELLGFSFTADTGQ
jgi:hypothetical protein